MNKRPTIQTIAELAGVSRGTVDRVLNNRSYVRADVRARVLNAIQETGYLSPKEAHRQAAEAKLPLKPAFGCAFAKLERSVPRGCPERHSGCAF